MTKAEHGVTIVVAEKPHQRGWADKMLEGLSAINVGGVTARVGDVAQTSIVVCWGWQIGRIYRERGHEVLVAERGYVGDRFLWTSLAWNGLNGHGDFVLPSSIDSERWDAHHSGALKPWSKVGERALILGQTPGDASLFGVDYLGWLTETVHALRGQGHDVLFRPHPKARGVQPPCEVSESALEEDLDASEFAVTFNSNSAVDAVLRGTPCIVADRGSIAWDVCGHGLGEVAYPDREEWAHRLAWKQWLPDELANGSALQAMGLGVAEAASVA